MIIHALLTRPPLSIPRKKYPARLACVRHAASVHPEPGSNSLIENFLSSLVSFFLADFASSFAFRFRFQLPLLLLASCFFASLWSSQLFSFQCSSHDFVATTNGRFRHSTTPSLTAMLIIAYYIFCVNFFFVRFFRRSDPHVILS